MVAVGITIKTVTGQSFAVKVELAKDTLATVKEKVEDIQGIPPSFQELRFAGQHIDDTTILADANVAEGAVLDLLMKTAGSSANTSPASPAVGAIPIGETITVPFSSTSSSIHCGGCRLQLGYNPALGSMVRCSSCKHLNNTSNGGQSVLNCPRCHVQNAFNPHGGETVRCHKCTVFIRLVR